MSLILSGTDGLSDIDGTAATPAIRGTDANTGIFFPAADTIAFSEGGAEAMRITSAGILDIGGTSGGSVGELLVVEGANSAGHRAARINNTSTTNGYSTLWMGSSNDGLVRGGSTASSFTDQLTLLTSGAIPITFYTINTERMRIDSSGNVSIGTSVNSVFDQVSGARPLVVQSSSTSTTIAGSTASITISNGDTTTSNTAQLNFAAITGASTNQYSSAVISAVFGARTNAQYPTGQLVFSTSTALNSAPTEKMRITSAGDLLVGGTSVVQNSKVLSVAPLSTKVGVVVQNSDVFSGTMYFAGFANSAGNLAGYIAQTGTTTVSYTSVSDYRLKENVTPMTGALEKVQALKPCAYTWKEDKSAGQGFIAHELQAVIPDCVVGEKDAVDKDGNPRYQGIDTSFLVATLTAALQELKALTDTQASTITALTARITALEST